MTARKITVENWRADFDKKLISAEEAANLIKSGDNIFIPAVYMGSLPHAIAARKDELRDVTVEVQSPVFDPGWLAPGMEDSFQIITRIFMAALARPGHDEGRIQFLPYTNGTWFKPYRDNRPVKRDIDVFLVEVSEPDENGFMTFGVHVWERRNYADRAKLVIAEIDRNLIKSHGDTSLHVSQVDCLVDITADLLTEDEIKRVLKVVPDDLHDNVREVLLSGNPGQLRNLIDMIEEIDPELVVQFFGQIEPDDNVKAIAENLKTLVRDGDTLQIGMGRPSMYTVELGVFDDCHDLSIFSEMACPGMGFLVKRGIATGKYATLHPGKAVFAGLTGFTREEIEWTDDNPLIEQYSVDYVVNIANIMQQKDMLAINNITQIDLTGQITCETQFGPRLINGSGGQIEFHIGAFCAINGRAVSLLHSTWYDGSVSTIVPQLEQGSMVTIPRAYADYVVTEFGVAELCGKTHRERAEELITVAHPDFRDELSEAAKDIY
jgi:4-hydroxybutyrate CoA-transferase